VFVSPSAPLNPEIGDLWFDCTTGQLLVYEACTSGTPKWTSGSEGLPVIPGDTTASPAFASGSGTLADPYICTASSASTGGAIVVNRVTITDLAPLQFVPIIDLNAVANGGRFTATNNVANASGILIFDILFNDNPISPLGTTYTAAFKVGYGSVYINAPVTLTDSLTLVSPGSISGGTQVGNTLTYTVGTAAGGAPPYTYSWVWRLYSDGSTLQTGGNTYVTTAGELSDLIYVTLTAEDNEGQLVSGSTTEVGPISKPPFPNPTPPTVPTTIGQQSCFAWDGAGTTLESDGCLLFKVDAGSFSQGPTPVLNGQTVCTKWSDSVGGQCGNAPDGTIITGCLFDANFSACSSLTINRNPSAFSFTPASNIVPGSVATSNVITPTGYDAPAFITVAPGSSGTLFQARIAGGSFQTVPATGTYTLQILPGQSLEVRFTTGTSQNTPYTFNVQIGDSVGNTVGAFVATTGASTFPTTSITFPTATAGANAIATSVAWGNGTTNISATGCVEFSVDGGATYTQTSTQINDGVQLKTRWLNTALCGLASNGTTITGSITDGTYSESGSLQIDRQPGSVTFNPVTTANISSTYTSNQTTPVDYNSTAYVTLAAGSTLTSVKASVGGTPFTLIPASGSTSMPINPGQTLEIQATTGGSYNTTYSATVELGVSGSVSTATYSAVVGAATPSIATPTIVTPSDGATNVGTAAGITLTSSNYQAFDGAGTHKSSSWQVYAAESLNPVTSAIQTISETPVFSYQINRSVRFNAPQLPYLTRTNATQGDRKKWTFSCWVKKGALQTPQGLLVGGSVVQDQLNIKLSDSSDRIVFTDIVANTTVCNLVTQDSFTNVAEWMHICISVNTTTSVSTNRVRIFVNGIPITSFNTAVYYAQNADTSLNSATPLVIGANGITLTDYLSSYLAAVYFVDGQALLPTSFGVQSGSSWVPIDYTGTFGTNGYELLFDTNNTSPISSTSLGKDTSGNNNDFYCYGIWSVKGGSADSFVSVESTTLRVLVAGGGGTGGIGAEGANCDDTGGGNGGGGGGIATTPGYPITSNVAYQVTADPRTPTAGGSASFPAASLVTTGGFNGSPGPCNAASPGSPSGAPQSNGSATGSGGGSPPGAGGGGAGGPGSRPTAGPGVADSITGAGLIYGAGGAGGAGGGGGRNPGGPGGAGTGLSGSTSNGVIVSFSSTNQPLSIGALTWTRTLSGGNQIYTFTASGQGNLSLREDWLVDSPTRGTQANTGIGGQVVGNYAVLDRVTTATGSITNGNLNYTSSAGTNIGTLPISGGKWYWEVKADPSQVVSGLIGVAKAASATNNPGSVADSYAYICNSGSVVSNGTPSSPYGSALTAGKTLGVAFDADNGKVYFAIDNVWQNGANPVTQLNPAFSGLANGPYFAAFGGSTASVTQFVNFGQMAFVYTAPTGFSPLIENPIETTLTFANDTGLSDIVLGDVVEEDGGDASGVVLGISIGTNQMTVGDSVGTWTVGSILKDISRTLPAPYPTTEPPDPLLYTLIASATNSITNLVSFPVAKPPLDPLITYYARVQYKSNAIEVTSNYSPFSQFTTGSL
jgi:hypothetical protein